MKSNTFCFVPIYIFGFANTIYTYVRRTNVYFSMRRRRVARKHSAFTPNRQTSWYVLGIRFKANNMRYRLCNRYPYIPEIQTYAEKTEERIAHIHLHRKK